MNITSTRTLIVLAAALALTATGIGQATAGQPAKRGCFGASVSAAAKTFAPFGANVVAPDAQLGLIREDVRAIKAGELPNEVFPNTCSSE